MGGVAAAVVPTSTPGVVAGFTPGLSTGTTAAGQSGAAPRPGKLDILNPVDGPLLTEL